MPDLKVRVGGAWQSVTTTGPQGPPGPAGSGGAHATTHTPGNTDPIPNVAWTNTANTFAQNQTLANGTLILGHAFDNKIIAPTDAAAVSLCGGIAATSASGGSVTATGNTYAVGAGKVLLAAGNVASPGGTIEFQTSNNQLRGTIHPSGGFSWGDTADPGQGQMSIRRRLFFTGGYGRIQPNTVDGADTGNVAVCGGGSNYHDQGAYLQVYGNEVNGDMQLVAGNTATGSIKFFTGPFTMRGQMHPSGGFSWGGTSDPGAGNLFIPGKTYLGSKFGDFGVNTHVTISEPNFNAGWACLNLIAENDFTGGWYVTFCGQTGAAIGSISQVPGGVSYNTTSDARLKTDRGRLTDTSVLQQTIVHAFDWTSDGTPGRGVFAQEAVEVAPFAVNVGTDELNEQGQLAKPWGVDYSKYVPDLITGWQQHDATVHHMANRIEFLEAAIMQMQTRASRQSWVGQLYQRIRAAVTAWWVPQFLTPEKD